MIDTSIANGFEPHGRIGLKELSLNSNEDITTIAIHAISTMPPNAVSNIDDTLE
jgi:hypothetical protein